LKESRASRPLLKVKEPLSIAELAQAESQIVRFIQWQIFPREVSALESVSEHTAANIHKASVLYRLELIMLSDGLIRIGGRLPSDPVILPNKHDVTTLIIRHFHVLSGHSGKEYTLAQVRQYYWIIHGRSAVRRVLASCSRCRLHDVKPSDQRMSDLPSDRITPGEPPFSYCGVDLFGSLQVKRGQSLVKCYRYVFTCLRIRAVHIEVVRSPDTDSFINALQRFICRRGQPKELRSDNGTNFVEGERELRVAANKWNMNKICCFLQQKSIDWQFNTPTASHVGGVWERQIRSIRRILSVLLKEQSIDDLSTRFCIVETANHSFQCSQGSGTINTEPFAVTSTRSCTATW